ncbi:Rossmann-like domain-containing protein [Parasulfitobacter algicola]|uniref:Putative heavy-metal chelation domain-containing protein n=1 Tax=Parasulfitobacter algicola TaxID=2614809 RepID=A0ABX2IV88_9RHOB|nr:DUF364 domain-containing protein [Sulfitobacter algicola]NSX56824.1 hypothetical protein [Sulfitobacter algicola]
MNTHEPVKCTSPDSVLKAALDGAFGADTAQTYVTGSFWVTQTTKFPGTDHRYYNRYLVMRIENGFGGCCLEEGQILPQDAEELSGARVSDLLVNPNRAVRFACLDAFLGAVSPVSAVRGATQKSLPAGTPIQRAETRDRLIAGLVKVSPGQKVGLIGVVNPLVDAIEARGAICLPCDFNMERTANGLPVTSDMGPLLAETDFVITTGMTLTNGSIEEIIASCRDRSIPLVVYSQTGSHVFGSLANTGQISGLVAETFPYSQFTSQKSSLHILDNVI